jgi:aromatic-L-amino-acid decarboxylase
MDAEEFQRASQALVQWLAEYRQTVERFPVQSALVPGQVRAGLPATVPEQGEPFDQIMEDFKNLVLPGITHWQHPGFMGYFPAGASSASILGELLSAGLGVQGMLWETSPACTELEMQVMDYLVDLLGLPRAFHSSGSGGGVIEDSASSAMLCALVAARERITGGTSRLQGSPPGLVLYASIEAHSSVEKAALIAGVGTRNLRKIPVDEQHALRADLLALQIEQDRAAGLTPFMVVATVGTTSTLAVDPLAAMGPLCRQHGLWLHVDAAMLGSAALCPEFKSVHQGLEWADSYCTNPHKWLLTNFDCDCFFVARRESLTTALELTPPYLDNNHSRSGKVTDYRNWQIPLGRRFRALKLWFVLRAFGREGLQKYLRRGVALAAWLSEQIAAHPEFELVVPTNYNLVVFRCRGDDGRNQALERAVNATGQVLISHTVVKGQWCLRACIGQEDTERRHVERLWEILQVTSSAKTPPHD